MVNPFYMSEDCSGKSYIYEEYPELFVEEFPPASDGKGTGRGLAGLRGRYGPLEPGCVGPLGFRRGLPGPLRMVGLLTYPLELL